MFDSFHLIYSSHRGPKVQDRQVSSWVLLAQAKTINYQHKRKHTEISTYIQRSDPQIRKTRMDSSIHDITTNKNLNKPQSYHQNKFHLRNEKDNYRIGTGKSWTGDGLHGERVRSPVAEDLSWVPSTYTGRLTTACNSSSRGPDALSGLWGHLCTHVQAWM